MLDTHVKGTNVTPLPMASWDILTHFRKQSTQLKADKVRVPDWILTEVWLVPIRRNGWDGLVYEGMEGLTWASPLIAVTLNNHQSTT